jgi:hypothetical protein
MKRLVALIVTLAFPFLFTDGASAMAYDCHSHDIDIVNSIQDAIDELASELRHMHSSVREYRNIPHI